VVIAATRTGTGRDRPPRWLVACKAALLVLLLVGALAPNAGGFDGKGMAYRLPLFLAPGLAAAARESFLVYLSLSAFGGRPRFGELPEDLQYDAKDLFGSYTAACGAADRLLHQIANLEAIDQACRQVRYGKLTPEALYVHADYVGDLPPLLRVYQGAARRITGDVDDATILKLNRLKPQVSFLVYPRFDDDPHPALEASIVGKLGEIRVKYRYFGDSDNPPILHRKDTFVPADHPLHSKFARLSHQEERAGLLDRPDVGTRRGFETALAEAGYMLRGHTLRRRG